MPKFEDLTGQKFGSLTAIRLTKEGIKPYYTKQNNWLCSCDCGKEIVKTIAALKDTKT